MLVVALHDRGCTIYDITQELFEEIQLLVGKETDQILDVQKLYWMSITDKYASELVTKIDKSPTVEHAFYWEH